MNSTALFLVYDSCITFPYPCVAASFRRERGCISCRDGGARLSDASHSGTKAWPETSVSVCQEKDVREERREEAINRWHDALSCN